MLLTFIDSLLVIFITLNAGLFTIKGLSRLFRLELQADLLGTFLTGLILSTVYFSLLSFWVPVNFLVLIPLACIGIFTIRQNKPVYRRLYALVKEYLTRPYLLFTISFLILLTVNAVLPPGNADSKGYHYQTIRWYEMYKVIPGLGNIHGRYAFNGAGFILQAPYSFTGGHSLDILNGGHSLYPLNGILIGLFFFWLMKRTVRNRHSPLGIVYFLLNLIFFRIFPINVTSPSTDPLFEVCMLYGLLKCIELIREDRLDLSTVSIPLLILVFAPIAKLSAYPVILVVLYIFFFVIPKKERKLSHALWCLPIGLLIYIPWLVRNVILSGYLIYPIPFIDLFHVDWKMPGKVLYADYYMINYWIKGIGVNSENMEKYADFHTIPMKEWLLPWVKSEWEGAHAVTVVIMVAAVVFSPLCWIILYLRKKRPSVHLFVLWIIQYACIWNWLNNSPDFRFGIVFMSIALAIPLFLLAPDHWKPGLKMPRRMLVPVLYAVFALFFVFKACIRPGNYPFTLADCWLYPLKDIHTRMRNNQQDFPYKVMRYGVKLYMADWTHDCINAPGPCMSWEYGDIDMRGPRIEDGFYNVQTKEGGVFPYF